MWMVYWKEILVGIIITVLLGVIGGMKLKINSQNTEILELTLKVSKYEDESKRLFEEYEKNVIQFNEKKVQTEIVYRDRVKYIQESVDENDSCDMVIDAINRYQF